MNRSILNLIRPPSCENGHLGPFRRQRHLLDRDRQFHLNFNVAQRNQILDDVQPAADALRRAAVQGDVSPARDRRRVKQMRDPAARLFLSQDGQPRARGQVRADLLIVAQEPAQAPDGILATGEMTERPIGGKHRMCQVQDRPVQAAAIVAGSLRARGVRADAR